MFPDLRLFGITCECAGSAVRGIGGSSRAARSGEAGSYATGALAFTQRLADLCSQSVGPKASWRESRARVRDLDAAGDLKLIATERHYAHRHSGGERLVQILVRERLERRSHKPAIVLNLR